MAKSKAMKQREKLVREGRRDPAENRSIFARVDMRTRRTKSKQEQLNQSKHKGHRSRQEWETSPFLFARVI
ncbi:MAG: hypothetical protein ACM32O_06290 [Clostridia bacterium]